MSEAFQQTTASVIEVVDNVIKTVDQRIIVTNQDA